MKLWAVMLPTATPPITLTADAAQRDRWIAEGAAEAVYEIDAPQVWPVADQAAASTPALSAPSGTLV